MSECRDTGWVVSAYCVSEVRGAFICTTVFPRPTDRICGTNLALHFEFTPCRVKKYREIFLMKSVHLLRLTGHKSLSSVHTHEMGVTCFNCIQKERIKRRKGKRKITDMVHIYFK